MINWLMFSLVQSRLDSVQCSAVLSTKCYTLMLFFFSSTLVEGNCPVLSNRTAYTLYAQPIIPRHTTVSFKPHGKGPGSGQEFDVEFFSCRWFRQELMLRNEIRNKTTSSSSSCTATRHLTLIISPSRENYRMKWYEMVWDSMQLLTTWYRVVL